MKIIRKWMIVLFMAFLLLPGCGKLMGQRDSAQEGEQIYQIYYLNSSGTRMTAQEYRTQTEIGEALIQELMEQFLNVPQDVDCQTALSGKAEYLGYKQEDSVLYLYFDNNYTSMKADREILCRAALVRTLTQIPGVEFINIYAGEQPLMDRSGMPVGMLAAGDFIDSISDVNAYEETELTLYFADETGEKLIPEKRQVVYNISNSLERVVVEQLISGPQAQGLKPVLEPQTELLNISVNENICYINFGSSFLNNALEVTAELPIYAIVNSLSELSSVNRIQITVNGEQNVMFRETVSLNDLFERNLDYLQQ
ncbi:MAG: GerMN domain-containing protein [Clostridiales bacterium]|nr:GerMN domain-containing protein [Clostridiales bacterium]